MARLFELPERPTFDERLLSFPTFVRAVLRTIWDVEPTRVQVDIARTMEDCVLGRGSARIMVAAQRGEGKSVLASLLAAWAFLLWPRIKVFVPSASEARATAFSHFTKSLLHDIPFLQHLEPDLNKGDRISTLAWDVRGVPAAHDPSLKAVGVMGQMAGSHADLIVPDDIEIPNNSDTPVARAKLAERTKELESIQNPGGRQVWLGTYQSEDSVYKRLDDRGVKVVCWPGRYPGTNEFPLSHYEGRLAPLLREDMAAGARPGDPTDPERFPDDVLLQKEAAYGLAGFGLQFMLDPTLSDAQRQPLWLRNGPALDLGDMGPTKVVWCNDREHQEQIALPCRDGDGLFRPIEVGEWIPWRRVVMSVDQSGRGGDETAYAVVGSTGHFLGLLDVGGFPGSDSDSLDGLARVALQHRCTEVCYEANFGGQVFGDALQARMLDLGLRPAMTEVRATAQKELRIVRSLEPVLASHRLCWDIGALRRDHESAKAYGGERWVARSLVHQLTRLTLDRGCLEHDDRVDALATAVAQFQLGPSPELREARSRERARRGRPRTRIEVALLGEQQPEPERPVTRGQQILRG